MPIRCRPVNGVWVTGFGSGGLDACTRCGRCLASGATIFQGDLHEAPVARHRRRGGGLLARRRAGSRFGEPHHRRRHESQPGHGHRAASDRRDRPAHDQQPRNAPRRGLDRGQVPRMGPEERPQGGLRIRPRLVDRARQRTHGHPPPARPHRHPDRLDPRHERRRHRPRHRRADEARARFRPVAWQAERQDRHGDAARHRRRARQSALPPPVGRGSRQARRVRATDQRPRNRRPPAEAPRLRQEARRLSEGGGCGRLCHPVLSRRQAAPRRGLSVRPR